MPKTTKSGKPKPDELPSTLQRSDAHAKQVYAKTYAVVAFPGVQNTPPNYPPTAEAAMIKNDLAWMADNRERILAEWSKRYETKAAPKN